MNHVAITRHFVAEFQLRREPLQRLLGFDMVSQSFVVAMERATLHTDVLHVVAWIGTMGDAAVCSLLCGVGACRQGF